MIGDHSGSAQGTLRNWAKNLAWYSKLHSQPSALLVLFCVPWVAPQERCHRYSPFYSSFSSHCFHCPLSPQAPKIIWISSLFLAFLWVWEGLPLGIVLDLIRTICNFTKPQPVPHPPTPPFLNIWGTWSPSVPSSTWSFEEPKWRAHLSHWEPLWADMLSLFKLGKASFLQRTANSSPARGSPYCWQLQRTRWPQKEYKACAMKLRSPTASS